MSADTRTTQSGSQSHSNRGREKQQLARPARIASIVAGGAIVALALCYCIGCIYFYQRFWPNTVIGDADISLMTPDEAKQALQQSSDNRSVTVSGQGVSFTLTGANAGLELNVDTAIATALADNACWQWPVQILLDHDDSDVLSTSFDTDLLRSTIDAQLSAFNSMASDPRDAFLYFDESSGTYLINPGSMGTKLDVDSVVQTVKDSLAKKRSHAGLTSANLVQQNVTASDERLITAMQNANAYLACRFDLTVNGQVIASVNPQTVKDWIYVDENYSAVLDDEKLTAWVRSVEATVDTVGTTRCYTRPDGKYVEVYDSGKGTYGWISDGNQLLEMVRNAVYSSTVGSSEIPFKQTAATFVVNGADWGSTYIDIDLTEQYVRYYIDGSLVWESYCISGRTDGEHETPTGVYAINYRMVDQTLVGLPDPLTGEPEYETFVNYWMPFIDNMYALHDNPYTDTFGPGINTSGGGSHGCVNLPLAKATTLFGMVSAGGVNGGGTPVVVHY